MAINPFRLIKTMEAVAEDVPDWMPYTQEHTPGQPRFAGTITAAAARIDVSDQNNAILTSAVSRYARTWQRAAWDYVEAIGEIRYGFNALAAAAGRAVLLAGIQEDPTKPPTTYTALKDSDPYYQAVGGKTRECMKRANEIASQLGRQVLASAVMNMEVAGEFYLTYLDGQWTVLSSEELVPVGMAGEILTEAQLSRKGTRVSYWAVRRDRGRPPVPLEPNAYIARIWKAHPRWQQEPSSSMIGVLDQCEALLLLDQMVRSTTRSRLFAGALFVPDTVSGPNDTDSLEADITTAALTAVNKEDAAFGVVPLLLTGPPEAGKHIEHIDLSRGVDEPMIMLLDRTLDRILTGIDLPKEFVKGLGSAKYANAVVLEEGMYRMHIAPMLELICDGLTKVYLRPRLIKEGFNEAIVNKMVMAFDPVNIVTRPDAGQAANDGFDRKVLSGAAWRTARGFSEADAPTLDEQFQRWQREKGVIPPDAAAAYVEWLGGPGLRAARKYVEQIAPAEAVAPEAIGAGPTGAGQGGNQTTGPQAQGPAVPGPSTPLPPELSEILAPKPETSTAPRDKTVVPGSDRRAGEMLPPK